MEIHLGKDSIEPDLVPGKLRFYNYRYCPYAHRTQLVLNYKKIPHDTVFINLSEKPDWYLNIFPAGKVPALRFNGKILYESLLLSDFLDELYPQPALWTDGPLQKILDKLFVEEIFGKVTSTFYKFVMTTTEMEQSNFNELVDSLKLIDDELARRGSTYFGGESPKMVDYMIWPWFERFDAIKFITNGSYSVNFDQFTKLDEWKIAMTSDEAVAPYYAPPEKHAEVFLKMKEKYASAIKTNTK
ncbi:pyrimidodiazepine synthase-like [Adelges cooleyi]|uniref:pyrimidodiazepine synthase-like n=1 Tax=Adelges cooleyi TaxID=133065 RepID=UPI00217FD963|nr:pyrimidodiazepine synthase-like [Adelges cooleyi]